MRKGFTLVELIIVIIIIGILASVGMTQYTKVVEKGRFAEARTVLGSLRSLEIVYNLEYGGFDTVANLDNIIPASCTSTHYFSYACATATGLCTATRCGATGKSPGGSTETEGKTKTLATDGTWGGDATNY